MLTLYLALGILGVSVGNPSPAPASDTPSERTIVVTRAGGNFVAKHQVDPSDITDYVINLSDLPAAGETLGTPTLTVLPAAISLGFQLRTTAPYAPQIIDDTHIRVFVSVDPGNQFDESWLAGKNCAFTVDVNTSSTPPLHYQRTCLIPVAQK